MRALLSLLIVYVCALQGVAAQGTSVPVLADGVSIESRDALRLQQTRFNLKFVFTLLDGHYVADVAVKIADQRGRVVVEELAKGPIMLARLPAGNYVATLTHDGITQTHRFALRGRGLHTMQMRWTRGPSDR
jgi:hypothetical protein